MKINRNLLNKRIVIIQEIIPATLADTKNPDRTGRIN